MRAPDGLHRDVLTQHPGERQWLWVMHDQEVAGANQRLQLLRVLPIHLLEQLTIGHFQIGTPAPWTRL